MTFQFRPAVREQTSLLFGLAGPSSSGKTFSALRLAKGLAQGGKIAGIDTESRRMLHYADIFDFEYAELGAPFKPERYVEALKAAKDAGAVVAVVDSMSHEHEGPGGILEWHEEELQRMAGDDFRKRERVKFTAWIKPKQAHNRFVNEVLQLGIHVIFCFRAKEKLQLVKNAQGKIEPTPAGWQPICSDRFEYEMTSLLMLPPNGQGIPDLDATATKIQQQHRHFVPAGQQISEDMGKLFGEWASGGVAPSSPRQHEDPMEIGRQAASKGVEHFRAWWNNGGKQHRAALKPRLAELQKIAEAADADDEDPFAGDDGASETVQDAQSSLPGVDATPETPDAHPDAARSDDGISEDEWMATAQDMIAELDGAKSAKDLDVTLATKRFAELDRMKTAAPQQHAAVTGFIGEKRKELGG